MKSLNALLLLQLMFYVVSFYFFSMEFHKTFLEYGFSNMADMLKVKELNIITLEEYDNLSKLNIDENQKCQVLTQQVLYAIRDDKNILLDLKQFFSSDRRFWHLFVAVNDYSKSITSTE